MADDKANERNPNDQHLASTDGREAANRSTRTTTTEQTTEQTEQNGEADNKNAPSGGAAQ